MEQRSDAEVLPVRESGRGFPGPLRDRACRARRLILAALILCMCGTLAAAQEHCDPTLVRPAGDPLGYVLRGDRCEGLYIREVAGSGGLSIASVTEPFEQFEVGPGKSLHLEWTPPPGDAPTRLRAFGLRRKLYYRMDTVRPPGATTYTWSADVLAPLKMRSQELGVVGWVPYAVGEKMHEVYVPLRIGTPGPATRSRRYVVMLLPGADLTEVFITLSTLDAGGRTRAFLKRDEPLRYGYYPAERGIAVHLPELKTVGIYHLQIGATLTRGGSATRSLFFYHPGG